MNIDIKKLIEISQDAGKAIMEIYNRDFKVEYKDDKSPLTEADLKSHEIIVKWLKVLYPEIPLLSEEGKKMDYNERKDWDMFWLIDPIDGTKEFIKRNGEFTVNIALIKGGESVLGVIYAPALDVLYYASKGEGAYKIDEKWETKKISPVKPTKELLKVVASRSHKWEVMEKYIAELEKEYDNIEYVPSGSSLKLCLVAEGKAHIYPRLAPTMEWDTGAGQAIAEEAGAEVIRYKDGERVIYNKENLLNPFFIVK